MRSLALILCLLPLAGCLEGSPITEAPNLLDRPALAFRPAVDLGSDVGLVSVGTSCQDSLDDGDCGLGEPSVEVAGDGTVYITGTCCLVNAPPVLVSRDGGETFQDLQGDDVREAFGIEADLAVDETGRFYVADIEFAGTFQVTVWEADGTYSHHTKWPAPPLVDRDWIRAEGDGIVWYVYNSGTQTHVYRSTDAAETFSPTPIYSTAYGFGNAAIRPGVELCLFGGDIGGFRSVDCTTDGGVSWYVEASSLPHGDDSYPVGAYDEAGRLWLGEAIDGQITVTYRDVDGTWSDALTVVSGDGTHRMPWITAGRDGAVAFAWYGTNDTTITDETEWFVWSAATRDGTGDMPAWDHVIADPEPIFIGQLGRDLLDFLQIDMGPDGALHIAYSKQRPGQGPDGNEEQLHYVRSEASPLAMDAFWYGP